jgi:hypothetical protein
VSDLSLPVNSKDIAGYFSKAGTVKEVIVPDVDEGNAFVLFVDKSSVQQALTFNGRNIRDQTIQVSIPTRSQLTLLMHDEQSPLPSPTDLVKNVFSQLDKASMLSLLMELTHLASSHDLSETREESDSRDDTVPPMPTTPLQASTYSSMPHIPNVSGHPSMSNHPLPHAPRMPSMINQQQYIHQYPKIAFFSGDEGKNGEVKYSQWRSEVVCLQNEGYNAPIIMQGIRRSLRGMAAEVLQNLGSPVSLDCVLEKFDTVFGTVVSTEYLMEDFYSCEQRLDEKVVAWGCRLETTLCKLRDRGLNVDSNAMLRSRFWHGLTDTKIKDALRHLFDGGANYQDLLTAGRSREHETIRESCSNLPESNVLVSKKSTVAKVNVQHSINVQQASVLEQKLEQITKQLAHMQKEMTNLKQSHHKQNEPRQIVPDLVECFYCHDLGHFLRDCPKLKRKNAMSKPSGNG